MLVGNDRVIAQPQFSKINSLNGVLVKPGRRHGSTQAGRREGLPMSC